MAGGGRRENAGRKPGGRNKKTLVRLERDHIIEQIRAEVIAANAADTESKRKRAKDVMEEFLPIVRGIAAYYQPTYEGMLQNPNGLARDVNEANFLKWLEPLLDLCGTLAKFQSPTFKAVAVALSPGDMGGQAPAAPMKQVAGEVLNINDPHIVTRSYLRMVRESKAS